MKRTAMKRSTPLRATPATARASVPVFKPRKCKACRASFTPTRQMQAVCGPLCAADLAREVAVKKAAAAAKVEKAADKAKREKLKTLSELAGEAQREVNRYVRLRDHALGCISCDKPPTWGGQWHAGHMRSVGASRATRFIVWAIRKQCSECNNHKSGNAAEMYRRMVAVVGQEKLDWLYAQNTPAKFSREYLARLQAVFRKKANRQEKRNAQDVQ